MTIIIKASPKHIFSLKGGPHVWISPWNGHPGELCLQRRPPKSTHHFRMDLTKGIPTSRNLRKGRPLSIVIITVIIILGTSEAISSQKGAPVWIPLCNEHPKDIYLQRGPPKLTHHFRIPTSRTLRQDYPHDYYEYDHCYDGSAP